MRKIAPALAAALILVACASGSKGSSSKATTEKDDSHALKEVLTHVCLGNLGYDTGLQVSLFENTDTGKFRAEIYEADDANNKELLSELTVCATGEDEGEFTASCHDETAQPYLFDMTGSEGQAAHVDDYFSFKNDLSCQSTNQLD